jgi:hypothetical protein
LLVGVPVAGLLVILRVGRALEAPPSIGGDWQVEARLPAALAPPCAALVRPSAQPALTVSQSGVYLSLTYRGGATAGMDGTLRGDSLFTGAAPLSRIAPRRVRCEPGDAITLRARVDRSAGPARMTGVLSLPGCPECGEVPFTATRLPGEARPKGGH